MSTGFAAFLFVILVVMIVLVCALAVYVGRTMSSEKYDERQQIDRGHAYRFSFYVGVIYNFILLVYFIFHTGENEWILEPFLLLFVGILLSLQSFHIYCVMTHSALPLGEKPLPTIIGYALLGGVYLAQYYLLYVPENVEGLSNSGSRSMNLLRLLIALNFFFLAILHLVGLLWKEKE